MNVLSLFDGISCGMEALKRANVFIENYYASEIDKNAILVSSSNNPSIVQVGDVTKVNSDMFNRIDLLIGGSPCQGFSFAGKQLNFSDPRSALFFEYVRLLKQLRPRYFLLENVLMKKEYMDIISEHLGVKYVVINSALVSAQSRVRCYWSNIKFKIPKDRNISLESALGIPGVIGASSRARYINGKSGKTHQKIELRSDNKANCMTTVAKNCMLKIGDNIRNVTVQEAEILQTLTPGYTQSISKNNALKAIGNGWNVETLSHIFESIG